ncbi:MAG: DUF1264 domain-containing protein [Nitrososphaerales archaeon]
MNKMIMAGIAAGILVLGIILIQLPIENFAEAKRLERFVFTKQLESVQDPGQGHEEHQIVELLPPKEGVIYSGRFTYDATAPVEVAILHDIKPGDEPRTIYTIDGEKKWAASLIYPGGDRKGAKSASMSFVGASLGLHTLDGTPFSATVSIHAQARAMMGELPIMMPKEKLYNPDLNPRQVDYPGVIGFNDLHIEGIRHIKPDGDLSRLQVVVHHHCKVYDDMTAACLLFPTGMGDQDKPYGIEYVITADAYQELAEEEKEYWHYHKTEFPRARATFPEMNESELAHVKALLDETYGKVFYFWQLGDRYPIGEPEVLVVQDLPEGQ